MPITVEIRNVRIVLPSPPLVKGVRRRRFGWWLSGRRARRSRAVRHCSLAGSVCRAREARLQAIEDRGLEDRGLKDQALHSAQVRRLACSAVSRTVRVSGR